MLLSLRSRLWRRKAAEFFIVGGGGASQKRIAPQRVIIPLPVEPERKITAPIAKAKKPDARIPAEMEGVKLADFEALAQRFVTNALSCGLTAADIRDFLDFQTVLVLTGDLSDEERMLQFLEIEVKKSFLHYQFDDCDHASKACPYSYLARHTAPDL